jgi:His/Glu/Gln/Arg/opine family amino acid ABC transporter permease subunit
MATDQVLRGDEPEKGSLINNPVVRGIFFQAVVFLGLFAFITWIVRNTLDNLAANGRTISFGFLNERAGFDVGQALIPYSSDSTYIRALEVGLINTLVVAAVGIVTATLVGFVVGIGRLSRNWLIRKICTVYVEVFRNIPPLLVIFFWYLGVLAILPQPRDSFELPLGTRLSNRGLSVATPVWGDGAWLVGVAFLVAVAMCIFVARRARIRQMATGQRFPVFWTSVGLLIGLPFLALAAAGFPLSFSVPVMGAFQSTGGTTIPPEFLALYLSLSLYRVLHRRNRSRRHSRCQPRPDGSVLCARPSSGQHDPPGDRAAGHAHYRAAADEPVPQPHEELLPGDCRWVCGPRVDRRYDPEQERQLDSDRCDLDGRVPQHQLADLAVHELVQQPCRAGRALR